MNIKSLSIIAAFAALVAGFSSCTGDLDRLPYVQETSETIYKDPAKIKGVLAKLYGGLSLSGQDYENASLADLATTDAGDIVFLRTYWSLQEFTTDEAIIGWNNADLQAYHNLSWNANGTYLRIMYDRLYFGIAACNEFLRQTPDSKMAGFATNIQENIKGYRYEARFLRAFYYWIAMDMYGKVPFVTESDPVGTFMPPQKSRADLFIWLETELKDLENLLPNTRTNEYGRVDKGAAWMLLAKMYLNGKIYTGADKYTETITYCNKIINANYSLSPVYANLFKADNNSSAASNEIIFPIVADGNYSQSYGNTTFIVLSALGGSMQAADYGMNTTWSGMRATKGLVNQFVDVTGSTDSRAIFYRQDQSLDITNLSNFQQGYAVPKFTNITSTGTAGSNQRFTDTDFPMFRLGDAYLMYAEAVVRGGSGGSTTQAVGYVNQLRERAYNNTSGNISSGDLTLDFLLAERGRELYWEASRRTDLVRFGKFTDASYVWPFKGGAAEGVGVDKKYNVFPIPTTDMIANTNLVQNDGY
ncbi:Starch-binding associating with outer membrane [Filimonas lacunae]|uniref:Starch-binding associating with outer membrane n=1 Tax=Filimonas lacunae TaxID=477680 RepID=A0A173MN13_9BACT|nr:RagB/SusD family nutrient uptake outer membrane protein [Filimonas lacunae]BAV09033.1 outer membrane protein SusD [Filimonas lacunae]SIS66133.1 Starch-binding associating with outer membrane [Filimonas lacunae]